MAIDIVINTDYGGFGLSDEAVEQLFKLKGWKLVRQDRDSGFTMFYKDSIEERNYFNERDLERDDAELVQVVKKMKKKANGRFASLKIVSIPDNVEWIIQEHDGLEWVAEVHRTWF